MPEFNSLPVVPLAVAALLAAMGVLTVAVSQVSAERRRRRAAASLGAIDFARTSFASRLARGEPMNELLVQLAEAVRDSFNVDAAEIWLHDSGVLRRVVSQPQREAEEITVSPAEESIVANASLSGPAWARTWLPALLDRRPAAALRIAPVSVSGQLLGLLVVERRKAASFGQNVDVMLEELAREVGAGLHKQQLDAALHASLDQLRRQAEELQASRARIVAAADAERRRMERDLHDGAQQHLVTIAVKARLIEQLARTDPERSAALADELTADVEAALDDLRTLAHGLYPPLLSSDGLGQALAAAARRASIPVRVETNGIGRYQPEVEAAVYYCCLEAIQNAAKHAGESVCATVKVWEEGGDLRLDVSDDGRGFDLAQRGLGAGLTNMSDRLGGVGGSLRIDSAPGAGTQVKGAVPLITDSR